MSFKRRGVMTSGVAPRVGAWIETRSSKQDAKSDMSHPVWVRGLKRTRGLKIEFLFCRTPCGCVD